MRFPEKGRQSAAEFPLCESFDVKSSLIYPGPGLGRGSAARVRAVVFRISWSVRNPSPPLLGSLPGLLAVLPVLLGTYLAPGLVRDGGAPHTTQSPRDLAFCRFAWAWRSLFSLRSGLCSYSRRFCSLASTSAGVGSTRGFGFFTFWLALADFFGLGSFWCEDD